MTTKTIQLSDQEIQIIGHALSLQPYGQVFEVVAKINAQLMAQAKPDEATENTSSDRMVARQAGAA